MLDKETFIGFVLKIDVAYQQFCIWKYTNNSFVKCQKKWSKFISSKLFLTEEFSKKNGCKYKNFWNIVIPTLQQAWMLSVIRIFDSAYFVRDKRKENPRLSLDYIVELLDDIGLKNWKMMQMSLF